MPQRPELVFVEASGNVKCLMVLSSLPAQLPYKAMHCTKGLLLGELGQP